MRVIAVLLFSVMLLVGPASSVAAQDWDGRGYVHASIGGQAHDQTFNDSATFTLYGETGASAARHSIGGGLVFDIAAGARVWRSFAVGLAYSKSGDTNDGTVSASVPHPIIIGRPREASFTAADLERSENVVHLQFLWMRPLRNNMQIAVMAGPSFFNVRQDLASPVRGAADIRDVAPFTSVTITNVSVTEAKDSSVGFHIGVDGTYLFTPMMGAGGFVRYSGASVDLDTPAGITRDEDVNAGGVQAAFGLRLRF